MSIESDIIVALSTPPGVSALALVRVSGKGCHDIISKMAERSFEYRQATHCYLSHNDQLIDDVVITTWKGPASYTGEDMVDISCHGNKVIVDLLIEAWYANGARLARGGEFTQRAFLNGKMDLTQAEAVIELIHAQSMRSLKAARVVKEGGLSRLLETCRDTLLQLLAHLEAYIDFPEEDIKPEVGEKFIVTMTELEAVILKLLQTADEGRKLRQGIQVALVGEPNVGKSSLLNALLNQQRSIVSDRPGTTRDTIEETLLLEGIEVRFIDTAGVRIEPDEIEKLGIDRTFEAMERADLILCLVDGTKADHDTTLFQIPPGKAVLYCITKADLPHLWKGEGIRISSHTGSGIAELKKAIVQTLSLEESIQSQEVVTINARHELLLKEILKSLERAREEVKQGAPPELVSSDLRQTLHALNDVVGEATNEEVLDRLFSTFCIGK